MSESAMPPRCTPSPGVQSVSVVESTTSSAAARHVTTNVADNLLWDVDAYLDAEFGSLGSYGPTPEPPIADDNLEVVAEALAEFTGEMYPTPFIPHGDEALEKATAREKTRAVDEVQAKFEAEMEAVEATSEATTGAPHPWLPAEARELDLESTQPQLDQAVEEALVPLLCMAAEGEAVVEQRRVRLWEVTGLRPDQVFSLIWKATATGDSSPDRISLHGLQAWLAKLEGFSQPVEISMEQLRRLLRSARSGAKASDGLSYEDFVAFAMPRDPLHQELRRAALTYPAKMPEVETCEGSDRIILPHNLARCFKLLMIEEIDLFKRQCKCRRDLADAMAEVVASPSEIFNLMRGRHKSRATADSVAAFLVDQIGALSFYQASALCRRMDRSCCGSISLDDFNFLVSTKEDEPVDEIGVAEVTEMVVDAATDSAGHVEKGLTVNDVLTCILRLRSIEEPVESAKAKFHSTATGGSVAGTAFKLFDRGGKGYVTHTDLWQMLARADRQVPLESTSALVKQMRAHMLHATSAVSQIQLPSSMALSLEHLCWFLLPTSTRRVLSEAAALSLWQSAEHVLQAPDAVPQQVKAELYEFSEVAAEAAAEAQRVKLELVSSVPSAERRSLVTRTVLNFAAPGSVADAGLVLGQDFRGLVRQQGCWSDEDGDLMWEFVAGEVACPETDLDNLVTALLPVV